MTESNFWSRTAGRRISRRAALRGAATVGVGLGGAALIGCGGSDEVDTSSGAAAPAVATAAAAPSAATGTAPEQGKAGQTMVSNVVPGLTYGHLDPTAAIWTSSFTWPTHSMLVRRNTSNPDPDTWEVEPDLASSWETPDANTFIFKIIPGVHFHDIDPANGRVVDSADVKFSLERIGTDTPKFFRKNDFNGMTITTPDAETVQLSFPRPLGPFWSRISIPGTVVLPIEVDQTEGELITSGNPVSGTGPFIHDKWTQDEQFSVKKNPKYFKSGLPYLEGMDNFTITGGSDAVWADFRAGKIDVTAVNGWTVDSLEQAKGIPGINLESRVTVQTHWTVFNTETPPYGDVRVRKAISLVTPRHDIVQIGLRSEEVGRMLGPGGLNPDLHGSATYSWDELRTRPGYRTGTEREQDIADAKKLLDAAGFQGLKSNWKYTSSLTAWPWNDTIATLMTDEFRNVGFDFVLEPYSYSDTLVNLASVDFDIYHTPQYANGPDADDYLEFYFNPDGARNYGKWMNDKFVELMEKQNTTLDPRERNATILEIVKLLEEENPRAPTFNNLNAIATQPYVHNFWAGYYGNSIQFPDIIWRDKS